MYNNKIVQIFLFVLVLGGIIKGSIWLTKYNINKQTNSAQTSTGIYGVYNDKKPKVEPKQFQTHIGIKETMGCKTDTTLATRVDKKEQPRLYRMLYSQNGGYCGVYAHILSMFHTFGQKELEIEGTKYPVQDPTDKKKLNLKLVEAYLNTFPETRDGLTDDETIAIYATYGKNCVATEFRSTDYQNICERAVAEKKKGADCELGLFGSDGSHSVNVKGVTWNPKKKQCDISVRSTSNQGDPEVNPALDTVNISFFKKGHYPKVQSTGTDNSSYDEGATLICCK